jgi:hypothetical protein
LAKSFRESVNKSGLLSLIFAPVNLIYYKHLEKNENHSYRFFRKYQQAPNQGINKIYLIKAMTSMKPPGKIVNAYKKAVELSSVKTVVHLRSIRADANKELRLLALHHITKNILKQLPIDVSTKFVRPGGFITTYWLTSK